MSQDRAEFILPKAFETLEELSSILDIPLEKYGALLNEDTKPNQRIALLKELAVNQKKFEMAFQAIKEANTPDNETATNVLRKLAVKIQYCDMLAKGSVLKSEVDLKRKTLQIAHIDLKHTAKRGLDLTTRHMQVVSSKADLVFTLVNQAATQEAFHAMVKSTEANESVNPLENKTSKQESIVLDDTKKLVRKIHKDEEHRADEITALSKKEAKNEVEEEKNAAALEAKFSEDLQDLGQEKIKKGVVKLCKTLRGNAKSTSKEHAVFTAMEDLSSRLANMSARMPNCLINQDEVQIAGVIKVDNNNSRSLKQLENTVIKFENSKAPILALIQETGPTGHSIESIYPNLVAQLKSLNVNSHKDGLRAITFLRMQREVLNDRIAKMSEGNAKPSEEVKKLIKLRDALYALEINANSANEARQAHEALTEIISKHHITEDSKKKPAGILDLDSHWTTCTLADNQSALRMAALEAIDSKMSAHDNTPMYELIELRHPTEIKKDLLPAFLTNVTTETLKSFKTAWDAGIGKSGKNELVSKFCRALMEKIEAHPELGQVIFNQKPDQPNYEKFRDTPTTASFLKKLNSFSDINNLDESGKHLKPEVKERLIREMASEFSAFMIQCGFDINHLNSHLEAFCNEVEKRIIDSAQSGKPIAQINDFEIVGRGSISDRVAQENRAEMIKLALDQLKPKEVQKIINEVISDPDISAIDPQIAALIKEKGVECLHEAIKDHFNLDHNVVERLEYKIELAWAAKGSLAVQAATQAARENFDINTVDPALKRAVVHRLSETVLKEAGLCAHLSPDQSGVNRMCLLVSREISTASAALVASTTQELAQRQSAAAEVKQGKTAPLDLSNVTRQRSQSNPQPPPTRLKEEAKVVVERGAETVQKEVQMPRQAELGTPPAELRTQTAELRTETRPRARSVAAPGPRATRMPTQAPPEPPAPPQLPAASWARPQGQGPKQTQETAQSPQKDDTHGHSDHSPK